MTTPSPRALPPDSILEDSETLEIIRKPVYVQKAISAM
jgi:hypothetical protein